MPVFIGTTAGSGLSILEYAATSAYETIHPPVAGESVALQITGKAIQEVYGMVTTSSLLVVIHNYRLK